MTQKKAKEKQSLTQIYMVKELKKSEGQKSAIKNIKTFYESREKISNCLMIILELYLKLNTKQNTKKGSKY